MSETPIYDALVLEAALADEEGRGLVAAIHERHRARLLIQDRTELAIQAVAQRPLHLAALFPFGLFR